MREPKFHRFPAYALAWPDVMPGDVIVSPESRFFRMQDWHGRTEETRPVVTKFNPLLVLARIDGIVGEDPAKWPQGVCTFVVYSITRGFLITTMSVLEKHRGAVP